MAATKNTCRRTNSKKWLLAVAASSLALGGSPALAYLDNYFPGDLKSRLKVVPQKVVVKDIQADQHLELDGISLSNDDKGFVLSGKTKSGKTWTYKTENAVGLGGNINKCDFDGNGIEDLVIVMNTGGCGMAPPRYVDFLLFDSDMMPHASSTVGFSEPNNDGVLDDLVMLPGRKTPVMVQQELIYVAGKQRDRSYWRWHFYGAKNYKLVPVDGVAVAGVTFPTFVWFTEKPNHKISAKSSIFEKITRSQQEGVAYPAISVP